MNDERYFKELSFIDKLIQKFRLRKVYRYIPLNSTVADLGAGNGSFLKNIERRISKGIAFDRYSQMKVEGKIVFSIMNFDSNKEPDVRAYMGMDLVTAMAVIEHVRFPERLIRLGYNMLKTGGKLIVTTPTPRSRSILEFLAFRIGIASKTEILEHRQYFWGYQLYHLAKDIGFTSAEWNEFEFGMNTLFVATK